MVDQLLLNDTLQKINASLNKRFEKDADLYISKQDEYEIKRNLCNEAYGGIVDMAKAKGRILLLAYLMYYQQHHFTIKQVYLLQQ